jgi:hypothetical protein
MAPEVRLGGEGSGRPSVLWRGVVGKQGSDALIGTWGGIRTVPRFLKSATMKNGLHFIWSSGCTRASIVERLLAKPPGVRRQSPASRASLGGDRRTVTALSPAKNSIGGTGFFEWHPIATNAL